MTTRGYKTKTMLLPKISEEKNLGDEKIQDFCASLKIETDNNALKKKLNVRSIYETESESWNQSRPHSKAGRSGSTVKSKPSSGNLIRHRLGFLRSHLFSAQLSKRAKEVNPTENAEEVIDLTNIDDAQKVTQRYYQELGICKGQWSQEIESYLLKFEDADLSFPKLWSKEELFERANKNTLDKQAFVRPSLSSESDRNTVQKRASRSLGKENIALKTKTSSRVKSLKPGLIKNFDQVLYSKPVSLEDINHQKSKLVSSHCSQQTNRLPSLNTRATPPKYGSINWVI